MERKIPWKNYRMKLEEFKKLEKQLEQQSFNQSFKNINKLMFFLSIFGNIASIFLAYFLVNKIIQSAVGDNPILVGAVTIILLSGLELLKREIFDKFSLQFLKFKSFIKNDVIYLGIFSLIIIGLSFYASVKGAEEFSNKSKKIDADINVKIENFTDSLNKSSEKKILMIEGKISEIENKINQKDSELTELLQTDEITPTLKSRKVYLEKEIKQLRLDKQQFKSDLDSNRNRNTKQISEYKNQLQLVAIDKKQENHKDSLIFVMISVIIELVILFGVYFNEYFKFRSYDEYLEKINHDESFIRWNEYSRLLDIIYNKDTQINDRIPSLKNLSEICKINGVNILNKDLIGAIKLFVSLNILRASGSNRFIMKTKSAAEMVLKNYFNIQ